ncbi:MAG TPA: hypothetical protein V6D11_14970 [Waterburya sp.]|jgi:hypothetical protein
MDISNPQNWNLIFNSNRSVQITATYNYGGYNYVPLGDLECTIATPVALVTLLSDRLNKNTGKPYFGVGAYVDAYLPIAGQESKVFSKSCPINTSTLLQIPNYGYFPYKLKLSFPYWIEQLSVTIRQYTDFSGRYLNQDESILLSAVEVVEMREAELARQVELLTQRITQQGG